MRPNKELFCIIERNRTVCTPNKDSFIQESRTIFDSFVFGRKKDQGELKAYNFNKISDTIKCNKNI